MKTLVGMMFLSMVFLGVSGIQDQIKIRALEDKNLELLSRLKTVTSMCLKEKTTYQELKNKNKLLKRSLEAVRRDLWKPEMIAGLKNNSFYGKGGDCGM